MWAPTDGAPRLIILRLPGLWTREAVFFAPVALPYSCKKAGRRLRAWGYHISIGGGKIAGKGISCDGLFAGGGGGVPGCREL